MWSINQELQDRVSKSCVPPWAKQESGKIERTMSVALVDRRGNPSLKNVKNTTAAVKNLSYKRV
jgi:hypothetical protein